MALDQPYLQVLRVKAAHIQEYHLRTHERYAQPPPFIIEIDGMSSTGKSRIAEDLDTRFRRLDFRVRFEREGPERIRYISRKTPDYNIRTGTHALNIIMDEFACATHDILIVERGIFDIYAWREYWFRKGMLTKYQRDYTQNFFLDHASKVALAYMVDSEPEVAFAREIAKTHNLSAGEYSNLEQLRFFSEVYRASYCTLYKNYPQIHFIDTTHLSIEEMQDHAFAMAIETLYEKTIHAD